MNQTEINESSNNPCRNIGIIIKFLQLFIGKTRATRLVSMVLIAAGVSNSKIIELTGLCDKSVRTFKKALDAGDSDLFHVSGGAKKCKLDDVEKSVIEELNKKNYYSNQQIVDMIRENFGINTSLSAVRRLLKKIRLNV